MQALQHKLALEANRVGELESLLSGMRTNQFKSTFSEQHSADKAGSLQARNTLLTQQVNLMIGLHKHHCAPLSSALHGKMEGRLVPEKYQ